MNFQNLNQNRNENKFSFPTWPSGRKWPQGPVHNGAWPTPVWPNRCYGLACPDPTFPGPAHAARPRAVGAPEHAHDAARAHGALSAV
jgi:hypothetical protein